MQRLIIRWAINALALYLTVGTGVLSGIQAQDTSVPAMLALALIFGLVNALIRPILKLLTCPLIILTLGLLTLLINAIMFWLTALIGQEFGIGLIFAEPAWLNVFLGSLFVTVISAILTMILKDEVEG